MIRITDFPRRFATASKHRYNFLSTLAVSNELSSLTTNKSSSLSSRSGSGWFHRSNEIKKHYSFTTKLESTTRFNSTAPISDEDESPNWYTSDRTVLDKNVPGQLADGTLMSLALPDLSKVTRESTLDYLDNVWSLHDVLFSSLQCEEAFIRPPNHGLRHPMAFYYGHTTVLYVKKLMLSGALSESVNEYFEEIYEVGVDEMSWDDMSKNEMEWPSTQEVTSYRRTIYNVLKDLILTHPELEDGHKAINQDSQLWALFMCFEHDRIHLETSSVLLREMPLQYLKRPDACPPLHQSAKPFNKDKEFEAPQLGYNHPETHWVSHPGGSVTIGKDLDYPTFGWDNEYGTKTLTVQPFDVQTTMVTNADYYNFVTSDGYSNEEYWSEDGWGWKNYCKVKHPPFWVPIDIKKHEYSLRTLFEHVSMPWNWPAEVNHHEAAAYCKWKAKQDGTPKYHLMTEAIHALLRSNDPKDPVMHASSKFRLSEYNLNTAYSSPSPVYAYPPNALGIYDVLGNAWDLAEDRFNPLPGFKIHPVYHDFSTPCFDNRHSMLVGGSFFSSGDNGGSTFSRYHFRDHFHQHSGFRLIKPSDPDAEIIKSSKDQEEKKYVSDFSA